MHGSTSRHIRRLIAPALLLAAAGSPSRSNAAACCASATSFGIGRLLAWEDWAVGVQLGHERVLGQYDSQGSLRWTGGDFSDGLTTAKAWAIVRLRDRVELQGWFPVVVEDRHTPTQSQIAAASGDAGAAVRLEVVKTGQYRGVPSFALTAGALAPTGKRSDETSPPLFAGTTGLGTWGGSLAVEAEYPFLPWYVRLDAGTTAYLPYRRSDTGEREQLATLYQAMLSAGREVVPDALVLAVGVTGEWQGRSSSYALASSLAWRVNPEWSLVGTVTNGVWPDGAGTSHDARLGFTLGVRRGHLF